MVKLKKNIADFNDRIIAVSLSPYLVDKNIVSLFGMNRYFQISLFILSALSQGLR